MGGGGAEVGGGGGKQVFVPVGARFEISSVQEISILLSNIRDSPV